MNWVIASLIMFFSSISLYLFVRKSQLLKVPNSTTNLAMFAIPCLVYFALSFVLKLSLMLSWQHLLILICMALFFSYLGNWFSLESIKLAPNPGYSLIISKSYVVFTTLVAIVWFGSPLTIKNSLAIIIIVVFSALVMISKKDRKINNIRWLPYAFASFFLWAFLALSSKYLIVNGVNVVTILFYLTLFVSLTIMGEVKIKRINIEYKKWPVLVLIGLSSVFFNLFAQIGFQLAPNIGYVNAVNASSISLVTLFSAYFFKDELSFRKIIGIFGVTAGLILIFL
ncbi:MAG: DMT family transporter [Patescibacteria group bacterium]|nr:DMT family transporter [Patescibacteria group bacterium]